MKPTLPILFLFLGTTLASLAQAGWTPEIMIKFKRIGTTRISPDGKLVAYTVSTPVMEGEKSEFLTHIWVATSDGKTNVQFTQGDKSCMSPSFSPDGNYLTFVSMRGGESKTQLWMMRTAGGEAEQITRCKGGVDQYSWSPDGKRIAYTQREPDSDAEEKMKKEKRDWTIVDAWKYTHLYTIDLEKTSMPGKPDRKVKRLTKGEFTIVGFDWSPDSRTIAFSFQPTPSADAWTDLDIGTIPSDSGAIKKLVNAKGSDFAPLYSPDGKNIAYVSDGGAVTWGGTSDVYIIPAEGGTARKLAETPDRQANLLRWSPDGREIFFSENDHTSSRIFSLPVSGQAARIITSGNGTFTQPSFTSDTRGLAFIYQTTEVAPEVSVSSTVKFEQRPLSAVHKDFSQLKMGKTELIQWKSKDGKEIEGLLTYPVNYAAGKSYPLILNIHGGPAGAFTQTFTGAGSVYPIQAFAQDGYAVLRPNPRGSSGYGRAFRHDNYNDWGFGDYEDNLAGVDKVISMGIAHPDSLVICGWSYGGYMASFTLTRTQRFKVASVGAGVTNLMSFVGTSDIPGFIPDYFGGEYWDRLEFYSKHSAMFNIKNVKTPAQVIHGERDLRVPPSQGFEFYTALRRLGIPTEMITYPRTPHGVQEPKFIQDIGERELAWFNKYLRRTR